MKANHPSHHVRHMGIGTGIYKSLWHLVITIFVVVLPFLFFLIFSKTANLATGQLFANIFISVGRLFLAYVIAAALGWLLAVSFYRGKRAAVALPIFDVLQSFPTFALLPLATLFLGRSEVTIVFFLVITVIWPIFFTVVSQLKLLKSEWQEAVQISGLRGKNYLKYYLWPASLPGLITGSIIGLGEGWEALVATEIIVNHPVGLGSFFQSNSQNLNTTALGIFGLLLIIFSVNKLIWLPLLEWSHKRSEE
jgi:ABC-type nitrate/sulfonate/bicarbonate transport system permease component